MGHRWSPDRPRPPFGRVSLLLAFVLGFSPPGRAEGVVQLACAGTLLEVRGTAEQQRPLDRLRVSLAVQAEAPVARQALERLRQRLGVVRQRLQQLGVRELRVTAPSSWTRSNNPSAQPSWTEASLQVSGDLAPAQLQALVLEVGGLPGVRLAPVEARPDGREDTVVRRQLLQAAYGDALGRAQELAALVGRRGALVPLEVQVDGDGWRPVALRAAAAPQEGRFDPQELPQPREQRTVTVRFCAL